MGFENSWENPAEEEKKKKEGSIADTWAAARAVERLELSGAEQAELKNKDEARTRAKGAEEEAAFNRRTEVPEKTGVEDIRSIAREIEKKDKRDF